MYVHNEYKMADGCNGVRLAYVNRIGTDTHNVIPKSQEKRRTKTTTGKNLTWRTTAI